MLTLTACSDDPAGHLPDKDVHDGNVALRFHMRLNGSGVPGVSRSQTNETPGTSRENAINTISLFVYNADTDVLTDYINLTESQVEEIQSKTGLVVPISARKGQKVYIYALANQTDAMRRTFSYGLIGKNAVFASSHTDYWDVIDEFVQGSHGHQTELENNTTGAIPMTGIFRTDGAADNVITIPDNDNNDDPLMVSTDMSRIVAKMHMLVNIGGGVEVAYVHAEDMSAHDETTDDPYANWIGWIRLDNVRYMPNGINKSTYIFPHVNQAGNLMDLNMNLTDYVSDNRFDSQLYDRDFVYYNGLIRHEINVTTPEHFAQAEAFDQTRLNNTMDNINHADRYTHGMYSPENYFDIPDNDGFAKNYDGAIPVVTHLTVAARLTPRNIVVLKDYADKMDGFVNYYKDNPDQFRANYSLTVTDFTDVDVNRWETVIRDRYFSETNSPQPYRNDYFIIRTFSEADAADLIKWSLMANKLWSGDDTDFENGKYPAMTFYVYDTNYDREATAETVFKQRFLYLTAGAVNKASETNMKIKTYSVPHVGGWGYYYTYFDQTGQTPGSIIPYAASQVTRNTYYLMTVSNIDSPGGTITRPEYIKVNTMSVDWVYDGRGDINLH